MDVRTQALDHHGLVAAVYRDLDVANKKVVVALQSYKRRWYDAFSCDY